MKFCCLFSMCTETFWKHFSIIPTTNGEQKSLNKTLANMTIIWKTKFRPVREMCTNTEGWEGGTATETDDGDILDILVLPQNVFCRQCCNTNMSHEALYLVHSKSGGRIEFLQKLDMLKVMRAWFLEQDEPF